LGEERWPRTPQPGGLFVASEKRGRLRKAANEFALRPLAVIVRPAQLAGMADRPASR
jgi:hypothetical protein